MTAPLAKELKLQGHNITGSDQEKIYPPVSQILNEAGIEINTAQISNNIDLVIVGSSFNSFEKTRNEFEAVKRLKIPYISATEYIGKYVGKPNSILIAGSYGKTSITNLLIWIYINAKYNPSYMLGGYSINNLDSTRITTSEWSIIEADESIHGLDQKAKFFYYPIKHLILTSAEWEHKDSYKTEEENYSAFKDLIVRIPKEGILLINSKAHKTKELSQSCQGKIITYNTPDSDYFILDSSIDRNTTDLTIKTPTENLMVTTQLLGQFNFENILAAVALADYLGVDRHIIQESVQTYKGVKRRLELISEINDILFFDDFAQSAPRIKSTIDAIKLHYPQNRIKVLFMPHASFLQHKSGLNKLNESFKNADEIILGKIKFNQNIDKNDRVSAKDFYQEIGSKIIYQPIDEKIIYHYSETLQPQDILIYMSSGGVEGQKIISSIINNLKNKCQDTL